MNFLLLFRLAVSKYPTTLFSGTPSAALCTPYADRDESQGVILRGGDDVWQRAVKCRGIGKWVRMMYPTPRPEWTGCFSATPSPYTRVPLHSIATQAPAVPPAFPFCRIAPHCRPCLPSRRRLIAPPSTQKVHSAHRQPLQIKAFALIAH